MSLVLTEGQDIAGRDRSFGVDRVYPDLVDSFMALAGEVYERVFLTTRVREIVRLKQEYNQNKSMDNFSRYEDLARNFIIKLCQFKRFRDVANLIIHGISEAEQRWVTFINRDWTNSFYEECERFEKENVISKKGEVFNDVLLLGRSEKVYAGTNYWLVLAIRRTNFRYYLSMYVYSEAKGLVRGDLLSNEVSAGYRSRLGENIYDPLRRFAIEQYNVFMSNLNWNVLL